MRRTSQGRWLLIPVALFVVFGAIFVMPLFFARTERRIHLVSSMYALEKAYENYTNNGSIEPGLRSVALTSNAVTIGNTQYVCVLRTHIFHRGEQEGTLAMTSNRTFIFLGSKTPPKIIPAGYEPSLLGY